MSPRNLATRLALPALAVLALSACSDGEDPASSVELTDTASPGATDPTDEGTADEGGAVDDAEDGASDEVVDLTEAIPGTWPVGDAGTVTFAIVDGSLVLEDVTAADGWQVSVDEEDADEIEVDFLRGDEEWEIEIELKDGRSILEIEIDQDIDDAATGSYDVGDAGTFSFDVEDGRLVLTALDVTDGWTVVERDEEADEIEFSVADGPRSYDVEVELDEDGTIELEIDYEVSGPVEG